MIEVQKADNELSCLSCGDADSIAKYMIKIKNPKETTIICLCRDCLSDFVGVAAIADRENI